ncbi:PKD domain-containing protein [Microbacterium sp. NPDC089189]|uniref:VWA domain-containing protein n=1 Tax=Microbacterium sp. NPDC089189 TaxID=3154972 RepID=UPI003445072E
MSGILGKTVHLVTSALVGALVLASASSLTAAPATAAESDCIPIAAIAFRGSGQGNIDRTVTSHDGAPHRYGSSALVTNGWEGATLGRMLDRVAASSGISGLRGEDIPVYGVGPADRANPDGYPAVSAAWEIVGRLHLSASDGADAADALMAKIKREHGSEAAGCETPTKFVVIGYSQGAMAARYAARLNRTDVVGYLTVGDPFQQPFGTGVYGDGYRGTGVIHVADAIRTAGFSALNGDLNEIYDRPGMTVHSLCHEDDPICDVNPWYALPLVMLFAHTPSIDQHTNYFTDAAEAQTFANHYLTTLEKIAAEQARNAPKRAVELAVVVDRSGSMAATLPKIAALQHAVAAMKARHQDVRVALVDFTEDEGPSVRLPFTDDLELFSAGVMALRSQPGADTATSHVHAGLSAAASELGWAPDATRAVLTIGDSGATDPAALEETLAALATPPASTARAASPVVESEPIVVYGLAADDAFSDAVGGVVEATGGLLIDVSDDTAYDEAFAEVLGDLGTAPDAALGAPEVVPVGLPVVLSGTGSSSDGADTTYTFDVDGDGVFDQTTADNVTFTPATAGPLRVTLRATDARGRVSEESRELLVVDLPPDLPELDTTTASLGVTAPAAVAPGSTLDVVTDAAPGETVAIGLVAGAAWSGPVAHAAEAVVAPDGTVTLEVPATLAPAAYSALVVTADARWGAASVTVTAPTDGGSGALPGTTPGTDQGTGAAPVVAGDAPARAAALARTGLDGSGPALWAGASALLLVLGGVLVALRRRTRIRPID